MKERKKTVEGPVQIVEPVIVGIYQVPPIRMMFKKRAATYLNLSEKSLREIPPDELPCYSWHGRRCYRLEDLNRYIESWERWDGGTKSGEPSEYCGDQPPRRRPRRRREITE